MKDNPVFISHTVRTVSNWHKGTLWRVNQFLQHIERTLEIVSSDSGDRTNNNATERIISLNYKIRAKTIRSENFPTIFGTVISYLRNPKDTL